MKLTKGLLTRDEAFALAPDYVKYIGDGPTKRDWDALDRVILKFEKLRKGQAVVTQVDGQFVRAKVSSLNSDCIEAEDGPVVRVTNGEYSWRVDGCDYAHPI